MVMGAGVLLFEFQMLASKARSTVYHSGESPNCGAKTGDRVVILPVKIVTIIS